MASKLILVTGATGLQGGAVVDALLADSAPVRALVRNPASPAALQLAARGVELAHGDFDDADSLHAATADVWGVFSMQNPSTNDAPEAELRAGRNLIDAAHAAGVTTFVQTSVARAGDQQSFAGWHDGRWDEIYWNAKSGVIDMVRAANFPFYTILKPALMMANFLPPRSQWIWPSLQRSIIETAVKADTTLDLIDAIDIGRFAAAAFADPRRFNGQEIDLAGDALTPVEIAAILSEATGKTVAYAHLTAEDAKAQGRIPAVVVSEEWNNVEGYRVDMAKVDSFGMKRTSFADFARRHAEDFHIKGQ
ncbi:NmrA/HSCARG family protein [Actinoplanes sp. Pm04-4]|uniref:NmrA/HSCARG family protein n=1 Tax=Paractinoplanes pyxinae TaxID=2997416 RepID=A0ABT4B4M9_9ACTN|nr:NmrA/HSCARG family protein [Actinoplanes pyxinae]MCY1141446.1 NmrA/HSCARG family protein [Actinoplanes pyxinae]